jgi:hypothetical protein
MPTWDAILGMAMMTAPLQSPVVAQTTPASDRSAARTSTGAVRKKKRSEQKQKHKWVVQVAGLSDEARQHVYGSQGVTPRAWHPSPSPLAVVHCGSDETQTDAEHRSDSETVAPIQQTQPVAATSTESEHTARVLRHLPAWCTQGTASIGPCVVDPKRAHHKRAPVNPPVPVIFVGAEHRPEDSLKNLPDGGKCHRADKLLKPNEHICAAAYSDDNGYTVNGTCVPSLQPAHRPSPTTSAQTPLGCTLERAVTRTSQAVPERARRSRERAESTNKSGCSAAARGSATRRSRERAESTNKSGCSAAARGSATRRSREHPLLVVLGSPRALGVCRRGCDLPATRTSSHPRGPTGWGLTSAGWSIQWGAA